VAYGYGRIVLERDCVDFDINNNDTGKVQISVAMICSLTAGRGRKVPEETRRRLTRMRRNAVQDGRQATGNS